MPTSAELQIVRGVLIRNQVVDLILEHRPEWRDAVGYAKDELRISVSLPDGRTISVVHRTSRDHCGWAVVVPDRERPEFRSTAVELVEVVLEASARLT